MSQNPQFDPRNLRSKSDADKTQQPRPPKPETEARLVHGEAVAASSSQSGPALPAVLKPLSSVLSVNAPEFKPKVYQYHGGSSSVAQPSPPLSVGAAEFVPRTDFVPVLMGAPPNMGPPLQMPPPPFPPPGAAVEDPFINSFGQMNLGRGGEMEMLLEDFSRTMLILTTHPANIRDFLKPLCDKLRQARTPDLLTEVINILYDQSIYEPNFRYTGARVVHFLCQELKDHAVFGMFKARFLQKCQQDYAKREDLMKSADNGLATLCGLTMFMGELFLNVTADASGQQERLDFLPVVLTDLVITLLSQPSDTSIKTACQLLKLAGGPTEDFLMQTGGIGIQNFHKVFNTLQILQSSPHVSPNMKLLITSVFNLRQSNWGRGDSRLLSSAENSHENSAPPGEFAQSEPVFYDKYGKPISREEAGYPEDEDEEEDYDGYELTEEEERDFLIWQKEASVHSELGMAAPGQLENVNAQPGYSEGAVYPQWSTGDGEFGNSSYMYSDYSQYNTYAPYIEDEGLNDEMEKAFEEFLSSQRGPPMGK